MEATLSNQTIILHSMMKDKILDYSKHFKILQSL